MAVVVLCVISVAPHAPPRLPSPAHHITPYTPTHAHSPIPPHTYLFKCAPASNNQRPLVLLALLERLVKTGTKAIIFAASVESTHRIATLLQARAPTRASTPGAFGAYHLVVGRVQAGLTELLVSE